MTPNCPTKEPHRPVSTITVSINIIFTYIFNSVIIITVTYCLPHFERLFKQFTGSQVVNLSLDCIINKYYCMCAPQNLINM